MAGRPNVAVDRGELESYLLQGFTKSAIAELLDISRPTLNKLIAAHHLHHISEQSEITDQEIDEIMEHAKAELPHLGERMVIGYFTSKGYVFCRNSPLL